MMNKHFFSTLALLAGCALALSGCGGAGHGGNPTGGSISSASPAQGQVALTIKWPVIPAASAGARPRLVPEASQSVTISLSAGGQGVGTPQTVARPAGQTTSTATFSNVPTGSVTVAATAFPNADGTGTALATGSVTVQVASGAATPASVTMASTIDHLGITPANPSVAVGASTPLTATAYDAAGDVVLTTPAKLQWSSSDVTKAAVDPASGVVTGVAVGTITITVKDAESGKTDSAPLSVSLTVAYTSILGDNLNLFPWQGSHIAILSQAGDLNPTTMQQIVHTLDGVYEYYQSVTGQEPVLAKNLNGKTTVAEVSK